MTPEQILANPPRVLTQAQRESYFEKGYVLVENVVPTEWLQRLREVTDEFVERSRSITESDAVWDLEPDHTAENPRLRRLTESRRAAPGLLGVRIGVPAGRRGSGCRWAGREISSLEAELQMGGRRRRSEVAPGRSVLAAHELLAGNHRDASLRLRARTGPARRTFGQPQRSAVRSVRRGRSVERCAVRHRRSHAGP